MHEISIILRRKYRLSGYSILQNIIVFIDVQYSQLQNYWHPKCLQTNRGTSNTITVSHVSNPYNISAQIQAHYLFPLRSQFQITLFANLYTQFSTFGTIFMNVISGTHMVSAAIQNAKHKLPSGHIPSSPM